MPHAPRRRQSDVSIVVASFSPAGMLRGCLESIAAHCGDGVDVIVATNRPAAEISDVARRFSRFRFVHAQREADVFRLRTLGALRATGRLIAFIEDHALVEAGWLEALATAHRQGSPLIAGPVDKRAQDRSGWGLYFCEYARFMPSRVDRPPATFSGVNVAIDRDLLWSHRTAWQPALYENELHDALRQSGHRVRFVAAARISSRLSMTVREAIVHLFSGGRHFGGYRQSQSPRWKRLLWIAASPLVPLVLLQRMFREIAARRPARLARAVRALPSLLLLVAAWSLGEACGYAQTIAGRGTLRPTGRAPQPTVRPASPGEELAR